MRALRRKSLWVDLRWVKFCCMATTASETKSIDVQQAASEAAAYFKRLYADHEIESLSLEEVELSEDGKYWMITLGYSFRGSKHVSIFGTPVTKYKVFKVNATSGRVVAMKIRKLE